MSLQRKVAPDPYDYLPDVAEFDLRSDDLVPGQAVPMRNVRSSAGGENVSPHLAWSGAPEGTKGYVVTCFDPDAPTACGFWHWLAIDLPADVTELAAGAGASDATLPGGAFHTRNDFSESRYDGSAPPEGDQRHRYLFVVHALDTDKLGVDASAPPAVVAFNLAFHTLARARLNVHYQH